MLTADEFVALWPEFGAVYTADPAIVEAAVTDAAALTDPDVFGDLTNRAQGLMAAHLLTADPSGREARVKGDAEFETTYSRARAKLEQIHCSHWILPE
jgi:hypothetical protein